MPNPQRIGLYLTDQNIVLAESDPKKLQKLISSPITSSVTPSQDVPFHSDITEEIHIVGTFQRILRESKVDTNAVCVSIPNEEIFLRSFVIPMMPENELTNVVFYEAKKYVPFDLKLLDYVYQAVPFVENKQKRLRIIFYAVRKQTLEKYDRIFKQTNCKPLAYEPSLVSLAKQLIAQKQLRMDQKTVVIYTRENFGQIIFYEKGISFFVRDFPLSVAGTAQDSKAIPDILRAQLLREIRKSFGYYNRQFSQEKIKEVLILASETDQELVKTMTEEFSVKVRVMEPSITAGLQKVAGMDALCACGASIAKVPSSLSSFNFLQAKSVSMESPSRMALPPFIAQLLVWDKADFVYAMQAAAICGVLLIGGFFYGQFTLQNLQKQSNELTQRQGELANKSIEEIDAEIANNKSRLSNYNKILHDNSHMAFLLVHLVKALSEGVWLDSINMHYTSAGDIAMDLQGYVYSPVEGMQFKLINELMSRLKNDTYFSSIKFKLNNLQKTKLPDREAFSFSITGS